MKSILKKLIVPVVALGISLTLWSCNYPEVPLCSNVTHAPPHHHVAETEPHSRNASHSSTF